MKATQKVDALLNHSSEKQQKNVDSIVHDVLDFGDLLLISSKGHGKTEALKTLASRFRAIPNTRVIIFEDFPKWIHEFQAIPFMRIRDKDVIETEHTINLEDVFLRHDKSFTVLRGPEIEQALKEHRDIIFLLQTESIEKTAFFIYSIVKHFYRIAYLRAYKGYQKHERIVFFVEESQNCFDSSTISKKIFNRLRKIFSVARNLGLHFVMASQRMQDLNPRIRARTRLMLGRVSQDDYELKIHRLLRHSEHRKEILEFNKGEWLYVAKDKKTKFPMLPEPQYKPYEICKPKILVRTERQPNGLKEKFMSALGEKFFEESEEDEEETEWDEFLTTEEEWLIDEEEW